MKGQKQVLITKQEQEEIKEVFDLFDEDKNGSLDLRDFRFAMQALGFDLTFNEIQKLHNELDQDGSGTVDFPEFLSKMAERIISRDPIKDLQDAFDYMDKDETGRYNGKIDFSKLKEISRKCRLQLTDQDLIEMIEEADQDNDGEIEMKDVIRAMIEIGYLK